MVSETCSEASEFLVLDVGQGADGDFVMVPASSSSIIAEQADNDDSESPVLVQPPEYTAEPECDAEDTEAKCEESDRLVSVQEATESTPEFVTVSSTTATTDPLPDVHKSCTASYSKAGDLIRFQVKEFVVAQGFTDDEAFETAYAEVESKFIGDTASISEAADIHSKENVPVSSAIVTVKARRVIELLTRRAERAPEVEPPVPVDQPSAEVVSAPVMASEPTVVEHLSRCDQLACEQLLAMGFRHIEVNIANLLHMGELSAAEQEEARRISAEQKETIEEAQARLKVMRLLNSAD